MDHFLLFFTLSVLMLGLCLLIAFRQRQKPHTFFTPYRLAMMGIFVGAFLLFVPYYLSFFREEPVAELCAKTVLMAAHHAIRLFVVGAEYAEIYEYAMARGAIGAAYSLYASFLFVASPLMTFGFILSMFEGFYARVRILFSRRREVYLFSCLNEQSLHLARDIRDEDSSRAQILFANVSAENHTPQQLEEAKELRCICLSKDILELEAELPRKTRQVKYFLFDQEESHNVDHALALMRSSAAFSKEIYVLSTQENYLFEDLPTPDHIRVFRVDHAHWLAMRTMESLETSLFDHAVMKPDGSKHISTLVLGLGTFGKEMVRALSWFTQAEGYRTTIHCVDKDPLAAEKFAHLYPGYFSDRADQNHCAIRICPDVTAGTVSADKIILQDLDIRYVFVGLGDDDENIRCAYELRSLFARHHIHPVIHAVVKDNSKHALLQNRKTYRGLDYDISFIGAAEQLYSYEAIFQTEMKQKVVKENTRWASEDEAAKMSSYSSNYRGGEAYLLHRRVMEMLKVPEMLRPMNEQRRWVQYMYSMGYQYASPEPGSRRRTDDLAKVNVNLVPFEQLPEKDKVFY